MSLLTRIEKRPRGSQLLRQLLVKMSATGDLQRQIEAILAEEKLTLNDDEREWLESHPVDFLLNTRPTSSPPSPSLPAFTGNRSDLKRYLMGRVVEELDSPTNPFTPDAQSFLRTQIEKMFHLILTENRIELPRKEQAKLLEAIAADILGYGPLESLLADESISQILVINPTQVYVTRSGQREQAAATFEDTNHIWRIIDRIVAPLGIRLDEAVPLATARLSDGSRVTAIAPTVSITGSPVLFIEKIIHKPISLDDLLAMGTLTAEALNFLKVCVQSGLNIIISGGAMSGKTMLLNTLGRFIPDDAFIIDAADAHQLQLQQEMTAWVQRRPPNMEGRGEITLQEIVRYALKMRPDRLLIEEIQRGEVAELLHTHTSWMATLNSRSVNHALLNLESLALLGDPKLPAHIVRRWLADTLDLLVHMAEMRDGSRKVISIHEVTGVEGDKISLSPLFVYDDSGLHRTENQPSMELMERIQSRS